MDPLVELPREKWPELRELFSDLWPDGAVAFCFLNTQIICPALNEAFQVQIFCVDGEITNGMVATCDRDHHYQVIIHPYKDTKKLQEALIKTRKIDWKRYFMMPSTSQPVIDCLEQINKNIGVELHYDIKTKAYKHILRKDSAPFEDVSCPVNTYIGPLTPVHIKLIDSTWTYHGPNTHLFFETLMKNDLTYVLYSEDHQPLAWVTVDELGALTHLYCLEPYRNKGYAEIVTKFAINDMLKKGNHVLAFTLEGNVRPQKLFRKLKFEDFGHDYWVIVRNK